ncbi:MAG: hypothetical protein JXA89_18550 [Anaerolineae bacterium]|nr:hypothetical protein [Anaerolineae bacterium]
MNESFEKLIERLDERFQELKSMQLVNVAKLPREMPLSGIYVFYEDECPLYVGRSGRIRQRLQQHCRPSSGHNSAPFAFRLAREATGKTEASYGSTGSRAELERDPVFTDAFTAAKARVRRMQVRFVEESELLEQTLLEIYAAVALGTRYNDFGTH